jgi:hypothetical protein
LELSPEEKSRCRFHLGYNLGANMPAGDTARLEEAMARIQDSYLYGRIVNHLDRCDQAYKISEILGSGDLPRPNRIEQILGDTNRSIYQSDPLKAAREYRELYLREVDNLAETLYVANYRREDVRRYAFERSGAEFIMTVPGPSDTSVATKVAQVTGTFNWR